MTSLTFKDAHGTGSHALVPKDMNIRVILDTGTTFCFLPRSVAEAIYAAAGVLVSENPKVPPLASCTLATAMESFIFGFGGSDGAKISVPIREFLIPTISEGLVFPDGTPACAFGVGVQDNPGKMILGDTFLRSAYVVFDLDNSLIGLAQSNNAADIAAPPQIQEIPNGTAGMPGASKTATMIPWSTSYLREWSSYGSS